MEEADQETTAEEEVSDEEEIDMEEAEHKTYTARYVAKMVTQLLYVFTDLIETTWAVYQLANTSSSIHTQSILLQLITLQTLPGMLIVEQAAMSQMTLKTLNRNRHMLVRSF